MTPDQFMRAIFGATSQGTPIVTAGPASMATPWTPGMELGGFTHWCISTVVDDGSTVLSRKRERLVRTYAIILDDIGTKIPIERLAGRPRPSFVLETSPGNQQWVYRLSPSVEPDKAVELMKALAAGGFTDPGACKPAQLARLPGSVKEGRDFAARIVA